VVDAYLLFHSDNSSSLADNCDATVEYPQCMPGSATKKLKL
jgi:hypothetical protein